MGRLSYRPIALDDLEPYAEFLADPECTRYLLVPEPHSHEVALALLKRSVAEHDGVIGMSTLHDGDALVGWAGYQEREIDGVHETELGWLIRRANWGRGYASEAALELRPLGPERTIHLIHPDNAASIAVARKLAAVCEREITINRRPVAVYVSHLAR